VAAGTLQRVIIVAFNPGTCDGKLVHQAVEWYIPRHGHGFDSTTKENICNGSQAPAPVTPAGHPATARGEGRARA
jgi:hypothetical protein